MPTLDGEPSVLSRVPIFFLFPCPGDNDVASVLREIPSQSEINRRWAKKGVRANLRVGLDLEPATAKMALASERKHGRRIVHSYLLLLCIVANTHANVGIARSAVCIL
jgi:hypothetical protein